MMFRIALLFALCLRVLILPAQTKPEKMTGLLWQISGKGIAKPGYLYGTMHVSEKLVFNLSDSFFIALRNVDMVALETDHDEWQQFTEDINNDDDEGLSLRNMYGGFGGRPNYQNLYNESFKFEAPENEMLGAILSSKPMMTNEFLYRSNTYRQEYEEDTYLDLFIFQAGRKLGKKVIGLETIEGSYEAAMRAQIPDDEEKKKAAYRGYFDASKMEEAYRNQDLTLLDSLNRLSSPGKNFQRWMLDERNVVMANRIDSVLQSGTALFSAVGAAHLPGETGVILLLRNKGYTVRPVRFTANNEKKDKEKIDKIRYPVKLSRQWSVDSLWSADAPGRFYPTANYRGFEQHLSADMNNGAFYAVYRMNTNGWWTGQSQAYIADRLDSLIYEKIPGKIQDRRRLSEPFPGHEITTRTRRGDVQRYRIYVTPFEVIMFTTGGNGDYALGEEASQFLNSIRFAERLLSPRPAPVTLKPAHGGFSVTFPASLLINTTGDKKADQYLAAAMSPADSAWYFLYRTDYHDWAFIEEDTFELNIIGEKIAEQFTKKTPQMRLLAESPYPAQEISFRADRDSAWYFARLVVDGPHYYLLGCRKKTEGAPTRFFESFSILPPQYPEGWKETADTALGFRVKVLPEPERHRQAYLEKLRKILEDGYRKRTRGLYGEDDEDNGYDWTKNGSRIFKSPLTGEEVNIRVAEYIASERTMDRDSFERETVSSLTRQKKMAVKESRWESRDSMLIGYFLLQDTNSTRGIRAKVVVAGKRLYTLSATVNLREPESVFVQSVFSSFEPTDSITGPVVFGERNNNFLKNIYSTDTLLRNAALQEMRRSSWVPDYKPEDFVALRQAVEHPGFNKLKFNDRNFILNAIGHTKAPAAVSWLRDFYRNNPDSVRYQALALQSLANLRSKESFKTLLDLWLERPVQMRDARSQMMYNFYDTLELSAQLFPGLLGYADVEANRDQVMGLLSVLVKKGLVKPKVYARLKPALLRETAWYLSQAQVEEEERRASKKNSGYNRYDYYGYGSESAEGTIERNFTLLAPFYKKDQAVRDLLDRAIRYGDKNIQLLAYGVYLENGLPVAPEKLKPFSEDDKTRYALFEKLGKLKKLRDYASWFRDTAALARSCVMEKAESRGIDSIRFVSKHKTVLSNKPATLYFFDIKREDDTEWGLAGVTMPVDFGLLTREVPEYPPADGEYAYYNQEMNGKPVVQIMPELNGKDKEEYVRKRIGEMRFANRERYVNDGVGGRYYYNESY